MPTAARRRDHGPRREPCSNQRGRRPDRAPHAVSDSWPGADGVGHRIDSGETGGFVDPAFDGRGVAGCPDAPPVAGEHSVRALVANELHALVGDVIRPFGIVDDVEVDAILEEDRQEASHDRRPDHAVAPGHRHAVRPEPNVDPTEIEVTIRVRAGCLPRGSTPPGRVHRPAGPPERPSPPRHDRACGRSRRRANDCGRATLWTGSAAPRRRLCGTRAHLRADPDVATSRRTWTVQFIGSIAV